MSWNLHSTHAQAGDLAELVGLRHSHFIIRLEEGGKLETHRGIVYHDDLIGKPWGTQVLSHLGNPFFLTTTISERFVAGYPPAVLKLCILRISVSFWSIWVLDRGNIL